MFAYSRWDGKSLSSRSGGSSHEDLTFSGTLISQTGDGGRFGSLLITLKQSSRFNSNLPLNHSCHGLTWWYWNNHVQDIIDSLPLENHFSEGSERWRERIDHKVRSRSGMPLSEISKRARPQEGLPKIRGNRDCNVNQRPQNRQEREERSNFYENILGDAGGSRNRSVGKFKYHSGFGQSWET
ncbi:hypothetical protein Tco_1152511 [Tanacetum coccineum]